MSTQPFDGIKADAQKIVDSLPANATWDDLMYRIFVRQSIERGLDDADQGRVISVEEVRRRFGLVT